MHSTKSRGPTRRVWRMTAENQLGEILELPDKSSAGPHRHGERARSLRSKQPLAPGLFPDSTGFVSRSTEELRSLAPRAMSSASPSTWRASSYDLLQGLTVRDVSERIPQPAFEALFTAHAASCKRKDRS
jgi:hypothetical protein